MAATQIDRTGWDLGDQIEAEWVPLIGVTYDEKDDLIEVALEDLDHLIRSPRKLFIDYAVGGIVAAIEIVDADGNQQIVRLKDPLALPAPSAAESREAAK